MKIYREVGSLPIVNREDAEGYARPVYSIEVEEAVPIEDYQSMERTVDKLIKALAEAEPIKHGRWIEPNDKGVVSYDKHAYAECSVCHTAEYLARGKRYCPNCGAKMDVNQIVNQVSAKL